MTAIGLGIKDQVQIRLSTTTVRFREISEREIRRYLESHNFLDKAGAYAIQGLAAILLLKYPEAIVV